MVLALMIAISLSLPAQAKEKKGFLVRVWEKVRKKAVGEDAPAPVKEKPAGAPQKTRFTPVRKKEEKVTPVLPGKVEEKKKTESELREKSGERDEEPVKAEPLKEPGEQEEAPVKTELLKVPEEKEMPVKAEQPEEAAKKEEELPGEASEGTKKKRERKGRREMTLTKAEMVDAIKRRLEAYSKIVDIIPGLSMEKDADGEAEYYYSKEGGAPVKLIELDKDTLYKLFVRISNEATRFRTERTIKQIEQQNALMRILHQQEQHRQQLHQQQQQQQVIRQQTQQPSQQPPRAHQPPPQPPPPTRR